ncbi:MAG: 3-mercaptopyruvate sulfurtransferase [Granulosicoccus sp.]|nr:3-mercaptopyruvate sulfurtransferase [Granulosicoccus sp.]
MTENSRPLVNVDWLYRHLDDSTLRIVDASWHMPATGRDAYAEYLKGHIPNAVFFDIDKNCADSDLPHMLPSRNAFADAMSALGISATDTVVVYDSIGLFSAPRVWWMLRYFGVSEVLVLDGGLPAWRDKGHSLVSDKVDLVPGRFSAQNSYEHVVNAEQVMNHVRESGSLIFDARSVGRFTGEESEPRAGLRSGHIPGSHNLPFTELLNNGKLKSNDELSRIFKRYPLEGASTIITSCGSGVTAALISLALYCIGIKEVALYDGSWAEWGAHDELPVAQGPSLDYS